MTKHFVSVDDETMTSSTGAVEKAVDFTEIQNRIFLSTGRWLLARERGADNLEHGSSHVSNIVCRLFAERQSGSRPVRVSLVLEPLP